MFPNGTVTIRYDKTEDEERIDAGELQPAKAEESLQVSETDSLGPRGKDMDGKTLVSGDRVEAKYKGRGTKYFSGKISAVIVLGGQTSFNIL